jgi:adenylate kinase
LKLIFLYGLPGVGKLTVARELAQLTGFKVFHNHLAVDLIESLFEFGTPPFVELREKIWLETFSQAVKANLAGLIFTFAFDHSVRDSFIENTHKVIASSGGEVLFVELTCSTAEHERRIAHPSRLAFGKLSSVERFRELERAAAFVGPTIPANALVIDTTNLLPPDAAALITRSLNLQ